MQAISRQSKDVAEPELWPGLKNRNGDWAVQVSYQVGDRVFFGGHVYRAWQKHQATAGDRPDLTPSVWALVL